MNEGRATNRNVASNYMDSYRLDIEYLVNADIKICTELLSVIWKILLWGFLVPIHKPVLVDNHEQTTEKGGFGGGAKARPNNPMRINSINQEWVSTE